MESTLLNWDKIPFLFMFMLSIQFNTEAYSVYSSNSSKNSSSSTSGFNTKLSFTSQNVTKMVISSNHQTINIVRPAENLTTIISTVTSSHDTFDNGSVKAKKYDQETKNTTIPTLMSTNHAINSKTEQSTHATTFVDNLPLVSNDALYASNSFQNVGFDFLENRTTVERKLTADIDKHRELINASTRLNDLISSSVD
ncbi:unnamed protein product, partial [Rotaria magnacalcarata]